MFKAKDWKKKQRNIKAKDTILQVFLKKKIIAQETLIFCEISDNVNKKSSSWKPKLWLSFLWLFSFFTNQKIEHFWGRLGFEAKAKDFKMCSRGLHFFKMLVRNLRYLNDIPAILFSALICEMSFD